jgi:1-acyl-sn-glycerol-3-phosphate acyltransferase
VKTVSKDQTTATGRAPRWRDMPTAADIVHLLIGCFLLRTWMFACARVTVRRASPQPSGPVVYACNHRSFLDPMLAGMWSREPIAYFARASLWENPLFRFILDTFHGIPVDRDNPGISSMKGAVDRLRASIPIMVFPEGTRTRTGRLGRFKDGPALFARRSGAPIVPVYVFRTERCWPRDSAFPVVFAPRVEVRYGRPFVAPKHLAPRAQDAWLTRRLELWMQRQEREMLGA